MLKPFRWTALPWVALMASLPWLASAQQASVAGPGAASMPAMANHPDHEHLRAAIRRTHDRRLAERLDTPAELLRQQCRFESDVATPPPLNQVALTFDDGPDPEHTEHILEVLERFHVSATFFFIGEKMARHPDLVAKVLASRRHLIGSHSWSHPNFHEISEDAQRTEIERGLAVMPPRPGPKLFRYPYGNASCAGNAWVHAQDVRIVGWHVDTCDWAFDRTGAVDAREALSCGVSSQFHHDFVGHVAAAVRARRGGIVLMHEIHANTLARLEELILAIQKDGFTFTRLDDPGFAASLR